MDRGGLDGRTGGDQLALRGDHDLPAGEVGHDATVGGAARRAADEEHPTGQGSERVGAGKEVAHHALYGGAGQLRRGDVAPQSREGARRPGPVRGPLPVEVRDQHQAAGTGWGLEGQVVESAVMQAEQPRHGVGDLGGVHGADQRQVAARRIGEPGDGTGGVGAGLLADRERGAARAEAEREVARPQSEAERGRHVVACARRDQRARARPLPGHSGRRQNLGERRCPVHPLIDQLEQVVSVAPLGGRPVARAGGVTPVSGPASREPEGQPVVGQQHRGGAAEHVRLAAVQPHELGDGEARQGDAATGRRPLRRATGQPADQLVGVRGGLGVVPELGRPQDLPGPVQHDQPVLLCRHRHDRRRVRAGHAGLGAGGVERPLPFTRVLLAARRGRGRVRGTSHREEGAGLGVANLHLACRRGRVDPDHEGH